MNSNGTKQLVPCNLVGIFCSKNSVDCLELTVISGLNQAFSTRPGRQLWYNVLAHLLCTIECRVAISVRKPALLSEDLVHFTQSSQGNAGVTLQ
jgi:hypothetical protein